jgi:hypothetical protein
VHTIKLEIGESVYEHIMFLLKNLKSEDFKIIELKDDRKEKSKSFEDEETIVFSNHTASHIEDWQAGSEDSIWK